MSDHEKVIEIIFGRWKSQILYAGVKLGIFDHVNSLPPRSADDIARDLSLDPALTYRLLRALGSMGLLRQDYHNQFSLTSMGELLCSNNPHTLRGVVLLEEGPEHYAVWKHLSEMVRDGRQDGFVREFGQRIFDYATEHPSYAEIFNQAMSSYSARQTRLVLEALQGYDFSKINHICDIGGGHGHLMCNLLLRYPHLRGTVLEMEQVIQDKSLLWANKMGIAADRCNYVGGDMFNEIPRSDAYIMKMILHDWDDKECLKILSSIQRASDAGTRLFVVEHIVPGPEIPHFSKLFDIHMLCALSGRERTEEEYVSLLKQSGFKHVQTHFPPSKIMGVVEATKT
ncbi:MAG: acetylserotonin O-methyltransferase [Thermoproteota archaeon]|nr:acetylserotonin O-methyltransferase [Thermoproteota archaeon]